jgi:DNA-binding MarR family transcriptional regulator
MADKLYFAPLPPRAIGDKELSGLDLRVLACIALHDRMSGKRKAGQGCWAGSRTLSNEIGCDYSNLSRSITKLGHLGYVERFPHPLNKRLRVYRVIYTDSDLTVGRTTNNAPEIVGDTTNADGEIVGHDFENLERDQGPNGVNIFRETEKRLRRNVEIDSAEAAPPDEIEDGNVGAELARFERMLKGGAGKIETETLQTWGDYLTTVHLEGSLDDPNAQRAGRLVDDVWHELHRRGIG